MSITFSQTGADLINLIKHTTFLLTDFLLKSALKVIALHFHAHKASLYLHSKSEAYSLADLKLMEIY